MLSWILEIGTIGPAWSVNFLLRLIRLVYRPHKYIGLYIIFSNVSNKVYYSYNSRNILSFLTIMQNPDWSYEHSRQLLSREQAVCRYSQRGISFVPAQDFVSIHSCENSHRCQTPYFIIQWRIQGGGGQEACAPYFGHQAKPIFFISAHRRLCDLTWRPPPLPN